MAEKVDYAALKRAVDRQKQKGCFWLPTAVGGNTQDTEIWTRICYMTSRQSYDSFYRGWAVDVVRGSWQGAV